MVCGCDGDILWQTKRGNRVAMLCEKAMMQPRIFQQVACVAFALAILPPLSAREPVTSLDDVRKLEQQISAVAEKGMKCTVALIAEETGASGSGVIASEDGFILTAAHVIEGVEEVNVVFPDGKQVYGKVLGANLSKDIGLVKITDEGPWPFMERGESKPLKAGDWVIVMGHSAGFDPARTPPIRFGRVISDGPGNYLTTDCAMIGGDSGGPLFDLDGRIVGVNSSIGGSLQNNNHAGVDGFKVDWDRLLAGDVWGQLEMNPLQNLERPVLGIELGAAVRGGGVIIAAVTRYAANAGLRRGDIIVAVNDTKVRDGANLLVLLAKKEVGETVRIGLRRAGKPTEAEVELVAREKLR